MATKAYALAITSRGIMETAGWLIEQCDPVIHETKLGLARKPSAGRAAGASWAASSARSTLQTRDGVTIRVDDGEGGS